MREGVYIYLKNKLGKWNIVDRFPLWERGGYF